MHKGWYIRRQRVCRHVVYNLGRHLTGRDLHAIASNGVLSFFDTATGEQTAQHEIPAADVRYVGKRPPHPEVSPMS